MLLSIYYIIYYYHMLDNVDEHVRCSTHDCPKVGGPPKAARPPLWRRPKAASIMCAGEAAKTCININRHALHMYIYAYI